ncbi:MAG: hypothetical protein LKI18_02195 [Prevotella sp.]|jgi:hypothetical protein|nr:hypothetical protein [Prevotella sp.]
MIKRKHPISLTTKKKIRYFFSLLLLFLVLIALTPLLINYLILQPKRFQFIGNGKDWLLFWSTYISAIASFLMVVITWLTLKQNREQLYQMKKQWEKNSRPYISVSINKFIHTQVPKGNKNPNITNINKYLLIIENTGISSATDLSIKFDLNSSSRIYCRTVTDRIKEIEDKKFEIKGKDKIQLFLWDYVSVDQNLNDFLESFQNSGIKISIRYNKIYTYQTHINIKESTFLQTTTVQVLDYIRMSIDDLRTSINNKKQ